MEQKFLVYKLAAANNRDTMQWMQMLDDNFVYHQEGNVIFM